MLTEQNPYIDVSASFKPPRSDGTGNFQAESLVAKETGEKELVPWNDGQVRGSRFVGKRGVSQWWKTE